MVRSGRTTANPVASSEKIVGVAIWWQERYQTHHDHGLELNSEKA